MIQPTAPKELKQTHLYNSGSLDDISWLDSRIVETEVKRSVANLLSLQPSLKNQLWSCQNIKKSNRMRYETKIGQIWKLESVLENRPYQGGAAFVIIVRSLRIVTSWLCNWAMIKYISLPLNKPLLPQTSPFALRLGNLIASFWKCAKRLKIGQCTHPFKTHSYLYVSSLA